jgi:hypothetical protein
MVTIEDIENHRLISDAELVKDLDKLNNWDCQGLSTYGNKFIWHYQLKNVMKVRICRGSRIEPNIYDIYADPQRRQQLLENAKNSTHRPKRPMPARVFSYFRFFHRVVVFKPTTAKWLYRKYQAKNVLDPCAGWGGRMLGAWSAGVNYTGFDTNLDLQPAYQKMMRFLDETKPATLFDDRPTLAMRWESSLDADFSQIKYDFVLTSPPYGNLELYPHGEKWKSDDAFYDKFLLPLMKKTMDHCQAGGHVCFNFPAAAYEGVIARGMRLCDIVEGMAQWKGADLVKKDEKVYIWKA